MQATYQPTKARCLALAAALSLLTSGLAQTATPPDPESPRTNTEADEVLVLSPFVVDASQDQGYRATSTLAGSRVNTQLKDVAQSITVVTKEFFTDLAAVGINDILTYTAGTEGTRDFTSSTSSLGRPTDDIAQNPNTANRIRGLAQADIMRDYFYTIGTWVGFDTYNLDQVTINRGPNSLLAGLGSPSGIINYSPQMAGLSRNKNEVSYRIGSFGDHRATLNSNVVALKDIFAVRVAAAWSDKGFKQEPAWNKDKRLYVTSTYQPWKKTTIRASYEIAKIDSNNPNSITPEDTVTQWVELGRPAYNRTSTNPVSPLLTAAAPSQPTIMFNANGTVENAINNQATGYVYYYQWPGTVSLFTPPRMADNRYFELDSVNLSPSLQNLKSKTFNFSIDQEIVKGLFVSAAYVKEKVDNNFLNLFRTEYATYNVDVNQYLPGPGTTANPHFMETYMQFRGLDNKQVDHNTNEVMRGTLTYDLNLTNINKWLGRYKLTAFTEKRETEMQRWQYNARQTGGTDESIGYRYYLGGTPANNYKAQTVPGHPALYSGVAYLNSGTLDTFYGLKSNNKTLESLTSTAGVVQGYFWDDKIVGMFGVRRDKHDRQFATGSSAGNFTSNLAGPYPKPGAAGYSAPFANTTKSYGVVVHPLKWLSLHYNHGENFIPNAGAVDLLNNVTAFPTGVTKDYGFSVRLIEDKLYAKVNWFELTAANAAAGNANFPLAQWTIPYMENEFMPNLATQAGIAYTKLMSPAINQGSSYGGTVGDPRLANAYTSDNVSKGIELELTYNVTKNWRVMASVTKQEAKQANIASALTAFIENRLAYWQTLPIWNNNLYRYNGGGWGQGRTGLQQWEGDNLGAYLNYKSAEGKPSTQLAKWRASVMTNYAFSDGALKGFSVGGGARYIEKSVIGNPVILNSSGAVTGLDLDRPYYLGGYIAVDAWVGYKMKVFHEKYDLSFQLNGRDLEQSGHFRPIVANSDGKHSVYRIVQPRTFYLTTTLGF